MLFASNFAWCFNGLIFFYYERRVERLFEINQQMVYLGYFSSLEMASRIEFEATALRHPPFSSISAQKYLHVQLFSFCSFQSHFRYFCSIFVVLGFYYEEYEQIQTALLKN